MYANDAGRKRGRPDAVIGNGTFSGFKRSKETESNQHGLGSKSKPCTKFFSTAGCPFGEGCHFLHFVPGGYNTVAQITNGGITAFTAASRNTIAPSPISDGPPANAAKTRLCNKYNTPEGCKFGDKCHFAHGERELNRPLHSAPMAPPMGGRFGSRLEPPPPAGLGAAASFGASATAKISVDASLAGAIIGKGGVNTKQICRLTGARLFIREHESDPNLRNIELEGTFDQIKQATGLVRELIVNISTSAAPAPVKAAAGLGAGGGGGSGSNFKTKMCDNFTKGSCTFGERCHFAHGAAELRKATA
ncbi:zinc finger CCCH domain-containing protein 31 [Phalaenopsis equestris]|uniref:zinc finger CCCH domain-containing protein 31 n=1 Tax=Phalaenopsis equestris TaxID=78828 RepID=UPI0009E5E565|nr:zinc finger CCCH domain-containing protein 31 [Phalaenopsis equestris]